VILHVTPINDKPIAVNDVKSTPINTPVNITVLANDTDSDTTNAAPQGMNLTVSLPTNLLQPLHGTISVNNNVVTYIPNNSFIGLDSFEYKICDNGTPILCDTAKVFIAVASNIPTARFDRDTLIENSTDTIFVLLNDSAYGNIVSSYISVNPLHGTVVQNSNGSYTYKPATNFSGDDYFTYTYCSAGTSICDTAIVLIHVIGVNGKPTANTDVLSIATAGTAGTTAQAVINNDTDDDSNILPEGNITTATVSINAGIVAPKHGTITLLTNGKFTYTPNVGFAALGLVDSFQYILCDNGVPNLCDTGWVKVFVGGCSLFADAGLNQNVCLGNSINIGGSPLTASGGSGVYSFNWISSQHDTLPHVANPLVTPKVNTTYYVTVTDGTGCFSTDSVILTIQQAAQINFNLDFAYCNNSSLIPLIATPAGGVFSGNGLQTIGGTTYLNVSVLPVNTNNPITYTYTSLGCTSVKTDTTIILASPIAVDDSVITTYLNPILIYPTLNDVLNGNQNEGINISMFGVNGVATKNVGNTIVYTPNNGFVGLDSIKYILFDSSTTKLCSTEATIYIKVNPIAINDTIGATKAIECGETKYDVVLNDATGNASNDVKVYINQPTTNGQISVSGKSIQYIPNVGFTGTDSAIYSIVVNGMYAEAKILFHADCRAECIFAQGLSPNGDKRNDYFKIDCALQYPNNEIIIFNRWGNEVYSAKPYKNDWEGTYQNQTLPDGTYFYIFKFNDNKHDDKQGYIVIHK
jgi:gliding motility-associated-like protein